MLQQRIFQILLACALLVLAGCTATGTTSADKRATIEQMHDQVLRDIYAVSPQARSHVSSSPGYAVFSNTQLKIFLVAAGGGFGVAKSGGRPTYMKMGKPVLVSGWG
ncbi:hypothetical protein [Aliamphritea spongicola]|nr:hypothetical protein [Aliamphritea spongicola]